jgi:hypothetical protein
MQRPFGCAQAPLICSLACVFASAGDSDATASAPAKMNFTIEQQRMN